MSYHYRGDQGGNAYWAPETAFRTNSHGVDTANAASDTFYPFPILINRLNLPWVRPVTTYLPAAAKVGFGQLYLSGYQRGDWTISGPLIDFSLFKYLTKNVSIATDTPSAGYNTYTYVTTTSRTDPPPSIQILYRLGNDTSSEAMYLLMTGCVVKSITLAADNGGAIMATITILFANMIDGVALTSWPTKSNKRPFHFDITAITLSKGGVAYDGTFIGLNLQYDDGTFLHKAANESKPGRALLGVRQIKVQLKVAPKEKALLNDFLRSIPDPGTASDIDLTIKMARNTFTDYLEFAFEKMWPVDAAHAEWGLNSYYLTQNATMILKDPDYETGAKLTITEVNDIDSTRYS